MYGIYESYIFFKNDFPPSDCKKKHEKIAVCFKGGLTKYSLCGVRRKKMVGFKVLKIRTYYNMNYIIEF